MGATAPPGSPQEQLPFSRFVLAAPHDNGMNSMTSADAVLSALDADMASDLRKIMPGLQFFEHLPDAALLKMLPDIVYGLSITQKKEIPIMLALGARYFEFRPAELLPLFQKIGKLENKLYFTHAVIPGLAFDTFLQQQVEFLDANPAEIVVIHIRYDNIVSQCKKPTTDELHTLLDTACSKARNAPLKWGNQSALSQPIASLRASGHRIILLNMAEKYDSWTAEAYATLSADSILARFEGMNTEGQESTDLTILQCQATSQSIKEVLVYSVLSANASNSPLTSTKGMLDMRTLPWLKEHLVERLGAERLVVVMNDFIDGATCDTAVELSRRRFAVGVDGG